MSRTHTRSQPGQIEVVGSERGSSAQSLQVFDALLRYLARPDVSGGMASTRFEKFDPRDLLENEVRLTFVIIANQYGMHGTGNSGRQPPGCFLAAHRVSHRSEVQAPGTPSEKATSRVETLFCRRPHGVRITWRPFADSACAEAGLLQNLRHRHVTFLKMGRVMWHVVSCQCLTVIQPGHPHGTRRPHTRNCRRRPAETAPLAPPAGRKDRSFKAPFYQPLGVSARSEPTS